MWLTNGVRFVCFSIIRPKKLENDMKRLKNEQIQLRMMNDAAIIFGLATNKAMLIKIKWKAQTSKPVSYSTQAAHHFLFCDTF